MRSKATIMHKYSVKVEWTGNKGAGTTSYHAYSRDHRCVGEGKAVPIDGSSDPHFRGDASKYNPEELFVAALSSCHMLWYLHLCSENGIVVEEYQDDAWGFMRIQPDGAGEFSAVELCPKIVISRGDPEKAATLHQKAHAMCFLARSVKFDVRCVPQISAPSLH